MNAESRNPKRVSWVERRGQASFSLIKSLESFRYTILMLHCSTTKQEHGARRVGWRAKARVSSLSSHFRSHSSWSNSLLTCDIFLYLVVRKLFLSKPSRIRVNGGEHKVKELNGTRQSVPPLPKLRPMNLLTDRKLRRRGRIKIWQRHLFMFEIIPK